MARKTPPPAHYPTARLIGDAPAIQHLRQQICQLARFDAVGNPHVPTVLLQGETGTGKGLLARLVHDSGPRASGPFIDVNCGALPETMLEAELFGFEAGAFTDAKRGKPGLFEAAAGGTLFLDEIDALPLGLQSKVLIAVEEKRVRRLGAVQEQPVDVKLIAATQVDLAAAVQAGRFRADLYHRLAVVVLEIPPLRARGEDIVLLAQRFLRQYATAHGMSPKQLSAAAAAWLRHHPWPGNVRELAHLMERVTLLCQDAVLEPASLAQWSLAGSPSVADAPPRPVEADVGPVDEPARIRQALAHTGGNVSRAAQLLGWSRKALRYRLQRYGIAPHTTASSPAAEMTSSSDLEVTPSARSPAPLDVQPEPLPLGEATPKGRRLLASGWEQRTVAVLAIDLTLPRDTGLTTSPAASWEILRRWEDTMAAKIEELGGVVLRRSPPLLVAAFGLLHALEQMPHRAVHAALTIQRLLEDERHTAAPEAGPELRQAVHLGPVLVDVSAPDPVMRSPAVGETLTVPMRLIGHTAPGEILASAQAARLLEVAFALQARELPLGAEHPATLTAYAITGRRPRPMLSDAPTARPRSRFVGREHELTLLHELVAEVEAGRGQVVGIVGEPGMGKSRLLWEFRQRLTGRPVRYLEGHCSAYAQAIPYFPVLDVLRQQAEITEGDCPEVVGEKVRRSLQAAGLDLEASAPPLFQLLGLKEGLERLASLTPQTLRARTFEALGQWLFGTSQPQPLVLAIEDLHWIDQTSAELLAAWIERLAGLRVMVLCTYRPGYQPPWLLKSYATQLPLRPLSPHDSLMVVQSILHVDQAPEPLAQSILAKAEGNPFFLEELAQGITEWRDGHADPELPDTLQGVLMARIDALPAASKRLLQTLAVVGKVCSLSLLSQVMGQSEDELQELAWLLQKGEFIYEQPAMPEPLWGFKHILTQEVAYHSLALEQRRHLHGRVARALEALLQDRVVEHYAELAQHYRHSGDTVQAVTYLQRAGQRAVQQSAYQEALTHLTIALALLATLPQTLERTWQELDLQIALGPVLIATKGHAAADVERTYTRARDLCQSVGDTRRLFPVLTGLWVSHMERAELQTAHALGAQLLEIAQRLQEPPLLLEAHLYSAIAAYFLGEFAVARVHLEQGLTLYTPDERFQAVLQPIRGLIGNPMALCLSYTAAVLGLLGYPEQALQRSQDLVLLCRQMPHPYTVVYMLLSAGWLRQRCRDVRAARELAEEILALAAKEGFTDRNAAARILRGWALAMQGQPAEGITQLHQGIAAYQATGGRLTHSYHLGLLAEAYGQGGQREEGLAALSEALALVETTGIRYYEAELYRLKGELLSMPNAQGSMSHARTEAETCFHHALDIARCQQAKSFELRAAASLARLWQHQGKRHEARAVLAPVYGWFTEGFDTADLQEAKALLDALA